MKICCIGDIHGTGKFLSCYNDILLKDNDCEKIIVFGDHFDPYKYISIEECIDKYQKFIKISKEDSRIISLLGNHDLSYYVIGLDKTSRTSKWNARKICKEIIPNLKNSFLCYRIRNYLFSHAGVSQTWFDGLSPENQQKILNNYKGWSEPELTGIVSFYPYDGSHYGDNPHQGCTWIRPKALIENPLGQFNQVVAHTQIKEITKVVMANQKDLWLIDNKGKPFYLTLNIPDK